VGKAAAVTLARLEEVARLLNANHPGQSPILPDTFDPPGAGVVAQFITPGVGEASCVHGWGRTRAINVASTPEQRRVGRHPPNGAGGEGQSPRREMLAQPEMNLVHSLPTTELAASEENTARRAPPPIVSDPPHDPLRATKLHVPRPHSQLLHRPHLTERLQRGLEEGALILLSAPAGYGKTTLLADWLAEKNTRAAWLTLASEENEAAHFLSYLIAALQTISPGTGATVLPFLQSPQAVSLEMVLTVLTNDLVRQGVAPTLGTRQSVLEKGADVLGERRWQALSRDAAGSRKPSHATNCDLHRRPGVATVPLCFCVIWQRRWQRSVGHAVHCWHDPGTVRLPDR
jgi:hypothetical protein